MRTVEQSEFSGLISLYKANPNVDYFFPGIKFSGVPSAQEDQVVANFIDSANFIDFKFEQFEALDRSIKRGIVVSKFYDSTSGNKSKELPVSDALLKWIKTPSSNFALSLGQLEFTNVEDTIHEISCIIKVMHVASVTNDKVFLSQSNIDNIKTNLGKFRNSSNAAEKHQHFDIVKNILHEYARDLFPSQDPEDHRRIEELSAENRRLQEQHSKDVEELRAEHEISKEQSNAELRAEFVRQATADLEVYKGQTAQEIALKDLELKDLRAELAETKGLAEASQAKVRESGVEFLQLEREYQASKVSLQASHEQQKHLAKVSNELNAQVDALKLELSEAEASHQLQIQQLCEEYQKNRDELISRSEDEKSSEVKQLKEVYDAQIESLTSEYELKVSGLERDLQATIKDYKALQTQAEEAKQEVARLKLALTSDKETYDKDLQESNSARDVLQGELEDLEREYTSLKLRLQKAEESAQILSSQNTAFKDQKKLNVVPSRFSDTDKVTGYTKQVADRYTYDANLRNKLELLYNMTFGQCYDFANRQEDLDKRFFDDLNQGLALVRYEDAEYDSPANFDELFDELEAMVVQKLFAPIEQEARRRKAEVDQKVEHYESASQQAYKAEAGTKSPLIIGDADCYIDINAWEAEQKEKVISEQGLTSRSNKLQEKYLDKYNKLYDQEFMVNRGTDYDKFEVYATKAAKYKVASSILTNLLREKSQKFQDERLEMYYGINKTDYGFADSDFQDLSRVQRKLVTKDFNSYQKKLDDYANEIARLDKLIQNQSTSTLNKVRYSQEKLKIEEQLLSIKQLSKEPTFFERSKYVDLSHKVITSLSDLHDYSLEQSKPEILLELCNSKDEATGEYSFYTKELLQLYISLKEILYAHNEELSQEISSKFSSKSKEDITKDATEALSNMSVAEIMERARELLKRSSKDDYFTLNSESDINDMFQWFIDRRFDEGFEGDAPFSESSKIYRKCLKYFQDFDQFLKITKPEEPVTKEIYNNFLENGLKDRDGNLIIEKPATYITNQIEKSIIILARITVFANIRQDLSKQNEQACQDAIRSQLETQKLRTSVTRLFEVVRNRLPEIIRRRPDFNDFLDSPLFDGKFPTIEDLIKLRSNQENSRILDDWMRDFKLDDTLQYFNQQLRDIESHEFTAREIETVNKENLMPLQRGFSVFTDGDEFSVPLFFDVDDKSDVERFFHGITSPLYGAAVLSGTSEEKDNLSEAGSSVVSEEDLFDVLNTGNSPSTEDKFIPTRPADKKNDGERTEIRQNQYEEDGSPAKPVTHGDTYHDHDEMGSSSLHALDNGNPLGHKSSLPVDISKAKEQEKKSGDSVTSPPLPPQQRPSGSVMPVDQIPGGRNGGIGTPVVTTQPQHTVGSSTKPVLSWVQQMANQIDGNSPKSNGV